MDKAHKTWHSDAALLWTGSLLQERFGHVFTLQHQPCNTLRIKLQGALPYIELLLDGATFIRADSNLPYTQWNAVAEGWHAALDPVLPAPGASALKSPLIESSAHGYCIHFDILGLVCWMLTRQEEVGRTDLDKHGRFPATSSHAYKHTYLERPIVDEWLHILGQVIERTWPGITLKKHIFTMKVSHDVDSPSLYAFKPWATIGRMMAGGALKRFDVNILYKAPYIKLATGIKLHRADPFNTFDWLMDVSEVNNRKSAFYFLCGRSSDMDADYEIEHPVIQELMLRIHRRGHEIGLHPSYGTYQMPELIQQEADRLRRVCKQAGIKQANFGGRMHYLRWEQPTTLRAWDQAGMSYDSTLGYADIPGFRCGTCFEYQAFDPVADEALSLRLRPLVVMECSVIDSIYLGLGVSDQALEKFIKLKEICRMVNGCFTLLWHNSCFQNKQLMAMYGRICGDN